MYEVLVTFKKQKGGARSHVCTIAQDDHWDVLIHLACSRFDLDGVGCEPISDTRFNIGGTLYTLHSIEVMNS